jgi:hypothetical protein
MLLFEYETMYKETCNISDVRLQKIMSGQSFPFSSRLALFLAVSLKAHKKKYCSRWHHKFINRIADNKSTFPDPFHFPYPSVQGLERNPLSQSRSECVILC